MVGLGFFFRIIRLIYGNVYPNTITGRSTLRRAKQSRNSSKAGVCLFESIRHTIARPWFRKLVQPIASWLNSDTLSKLTKKAYNLGHVLLDEALNFWKYVAKTVVTLELLAQL